MTFSSGISIIKVDQMCMIATIQIKEIYRCQEMNSQ